MSEPGKRRYSPEGVLLPHGGVAPWARVAPDSADGEKALLLTAKAETADAAEASIEYRLALSPFRLDLVRRSRSISPSAKLS